MGVIVFLCWLELSRRQHHVLSPEAHKHGLSMQRGVLTEYSFHNYSPKIFVA